jgi:hypothetical protein
MVFEVLTAEVTKISTFWNIMSYSPLKVNRSFEGTSLPSSVSKKKQETGVKEVASRSLLP